MDKRKEKKRRRRRNAPDISAKIDPGLQNAYMSDPIALWQDGEYWALDALYADPDGTPANTITEPNQSNAGTSEDDEISF